jgi:protein tyrosine/serine phosphatase
MVKWFVGILFVVGVGVALALLPSSPDAVSSATVPSTKTVQLPKPSADYRVYQVKGLHKFVVTLSPILYRGGLIETVEGMEALQKRGIKTIVSIVPSDQERAMAKQFGIRLVELPFPNEKLPFEVIDRFKEVLAQNEPIYLHCHGGTHRAGVLGLYYRLWSGWSYERALKEFVALGGFPQKDFALLESVKEYEVHHENK